MLAVLIVLIGGYAILNTATDIFPNIKIPIAAVIWRYNGILPEEIANRIVLFSERIAQTTVNDVEHTESQSVDGTAVVKYFFQPDVDQDLSMAQITAVSQIADCILAARHDPAVHLVVQRLQRADIAAGAQQSYSAAKRRSIRSGQYHLAHPARNRRGRVDALSLTAASSARCRSISTRKRCARMDLSGSDVVAAIGAQNLILPAGTEKIGALEYFIKLNASPLADRGLEQPADSRRQRHRDLCARRRACAGRLFAADQHRALRGPAGRVDELC